MQNMRMRSNIFTQQKNRRYSNLFITHSYFADIIDTASSGGISSKIKFIDGGDEFHRNFLARGYKKRREGKMRLRIKIRKKRDKKRKEWKSEKEIGYERKERIKEEENERVTVIFTELLRSTTSSFSFHYNVSTFVKGKKRK